MLCSHGCGQEAKFYFKNGKGSCESHYSKCPIIRKNHSNKIKEKFKDIDFHSNHCFLMRQRFEDIPDLRERLSTSHKERFEDPKIVEENSRRMKKFYIDNPEAGKIHSDKLKEYYKNPENRKQSSDSHKKYFENPENRKKNSNSLKKYYENPEARDKSSKSQKKRFENPENRKQLSESRLRYLKETPEFHIKHSIFMKKFLQENPEKHPLSILNQKGYMSSIERKVKDILDELNIEYEPQYPINGFFPDFAIPSKNIIIECDGDYWHNLPGAKEEDLVRQEILESLGWKFIRFTETEINKNIEFVRDTIQLKINNIKTLHF
jgi:very-short-patch-repair endonuclease